MKTARGLGCVLVLTMLGCGARTGSMEGGDDDDEAELPRAVRDRFGPRASHAPELVGRTKMLQRDLWGEERSGVIDFRADGTLEVIDPPATAGVPPLVRVNRTNSLFALRRFDEHGTSRGVGCSLGSLWRSIDERRFSILFHCSDGTPREAVLRMAVTVSRLEVTERTEMALETVGDEPVVPPRTPVETGWGPTPFAFDRRGDR